VVDVFLLIAIVGILAVLLLVFLLVLRVLVFIFLAKSAVVFVKLAVLSSFRGVNIFI
jgi:hypothetical protein